MSNYSMYYYYNPLKYADTLRLCDSKYNCPKKTVDVNLAGFPVEQVSVSFNKADGSVNVYIGNDKKLAKRVTVPQGYTFTKWTMQDGLALLYLDPLVEEVFVDRSES